MRFTSVTHKTYCFQRRQGKFSGQGPRPHLGGRPRARILEIAHVHKIGFRECEHLGPRGLCQGVGVRVAGGRDARVRRPRLGARFGRLIGAHRILERDCRAQRALRRRHLRDRFLQPRKEAPQLSELPGIFTSSFTNALASIHMQTQEPKWLVHMSPGTTIQFCVGKMVNPMPTLK